ncbi:CPBP family glutamic-type intramembrane protease, partial [Desertihabitans aurantiacus]|uniref:CPBP family glutamic-type intramembrane protease n=1 Tax=Desertihabitans aurantiacus TaxID=2282477 RepID=UPI000DF75CC7
TALVGRALLQVAGDPERAADGDRGPVPAGARRRRRVVVAGTLVVGTALLGWSLTRPPGDPWFVTSTFALAAVWVVGALLSGPLPLGRWVTGSGRVVRPVLPGLGIGASAVALFCAGGFLVSQVEVLQAAVLAVLSHLQWSGLGLVVAAALVNAVAEELFFRGALHDAVDEPRRPWRAVLATTVVYTVVTAASLNVALVLAAALLGTLCGLHRRATGGVLGPVLVHVVWSTGMVVLLRPVVLAAG